MASDYIGYNPTKWIERLRIVNDGSKFPAADKVLIENALKQLKENLRKQKIEGF